MPDKLAQLRTALVWTWTALVLFVLAHLAIALLGDATPLEEIIGLAGFLATGNAGRRTWAAFHDSKERTLA